MLTDIFVLFGAVSLSDALKLSPKQSIYLVLLTVCNFGLFLVDHVHFQYNGLIIGISLLFLGQLIKGNLIMAALIFSCMLNLKVLISFCWKLL